MDQTYFNGQKSNADILKNCEEALHFVIELGYADMHVKMTVSIFGLCFGPISMTKRNFSTAQSKTNMHPGENQQY